MACDVMRWDEMGMLDFFGRILNIGIMKDYGV